MQDSPFSRITRTSRRLNLALFGVLPIALVLISAILWSWQRLIKQEEEKLLLDFTVFMGYIEAEERFLQGFRTQNALLQGPPSSPDVSWHETPPSERQGTAFYEGRRPLFSTPFTVSCLSADCTRDQAQLSAMGSYLSAYYSTYWPTTYYPAAAAFLVNASDSVSISVPALDMPSSFRPLSQSTYLTSVDAIREQIELNHIVEQRLIDLHAPPTCTNARRSSGSPRRPARTASSACCPPACRPASGGPKPAPRPMSTSPPCSTGTASTSSTASCPPACTTNSG